LKIAQVLQQAKALGLDHLDAQTLLLHVLGLDLHDRAWLLKQDGDEPHPDALAAFNHLVQRRLQHEPLGYLTGWQDFYGLRLQVDKRVLVPRPDTETLVDWALALGPSSARVVDLGTGSGAIALALKHARPHWQVCAVDDSPDALAVAEQNAHRLQLTVAFVQGNWLSHTQGPFDLIVSNPPYIAVGDPHWPNLVAEPRQALVSGQDGLNAIRIITAQATAHLSPGGWLLFEHGHDQGSAVQTLLSQSGFMQVQSRNDLAGIARCTGGLWPEVK